MDNMECPLENFLLVSAAHGTLTHTLAGREEEKRGKQANEPRMVYYLRYFFFN